MLFSFCYFFFVSKSPMSTRKINRHAEDITSITKVLYLQWDPYWVALSLSYNEHQAEESRAVLVLIFHVANATVILSVLLIPWPHTIVTMLKCLLVPEMRAKKNEKNKKKRINNNNKKRTEMKITHLHARKTLCKLLDESLDERRM